MRWAAGGMGVVALLALGACRSPEAGPPALNVPAEGLRCELLLPPELREAMLPGAQLGESRPCPTCGPVCSLRVAGAPEPVASVAYDCRTRLETDPLRLLAPVLRAGGEELPALGRAAARTSPAPGLVQVVSFDDDTPCGLVVSWLGAGGERAVDLSRAALQAATPDSVTGVAPPPPFDFSAPAPDGGVDGANAGGSEADAGADAGTPELPPDAGPAPAPRLRRPRRVEVPDAGALPAPAAPPAPAPAPAEPAPAAPPTPPDAGTLP